MGILKNTRDFTAPGAGKEHTSEVRGGGRDPAVRRPGSGHGRENTTLAVVKYNLRRGVGLMKFLKMVLDPSPPPLIARCVAPSTSCKPFPLDVQIYVHVFQASALISKWMGLKYTDIYETDIDTHT